MKKAAMIIMALMTAGFISAGSRLSDHGEQVTISAQAGQTAPFGYMAASATTVCAHTKLKITNWQWLAPQDMNARWYFRIKHKDKPEEITDVTGLLDSKTVINGNDYYYYYVPLENKGNIVRYTKDGAFIRNLKFPIFGFIFLDVVLDPEINYLRFPVVPGDQWISKSTGTVELMKFFKVSKSTTTKFTVLDPVDVIIDGKIEHAFRIASEIDKGEGKIDHEENWYAVNIGLIYQNTEAYTIEIVKFTPGSAPDDMHNISNGDKSVNLPGKN